MEDGTSLREDGRTRESPLGDVEPYFWCLVLRDLKCTLTNHYNGIGSKGVLDWVFLLSSSS